ncbi:hypothetical protein EVAR_83828_1 [Eumeta japonica]|uniref:Uncharacterized protein n=1 Tax=Eumeta variegata TaxID=151549 RepID=A0A4C1WHP2_EUMVA|nr:hypothetical protein EVAR_83828_1 [Eumeta japonica]
MRSARALMVAVLLSACAGGLADWLQVTHPEVAPADTVARLARMVRAVASTVAAGADKAGHLRRLRRALLQHIEERVEAHWPDAAARAAFPTAESALMSISFLTFAVFLVKLVLTAKPSGKHSNIPVSSFKSHRSLTSLSLHLPFRETTQ